MPDPNYVSEIEREDGTVLTIKDAEARAAIDGKVDKETGKGLSTNDYTTSEKTKLAGIEEQANKTTIDDAISDSSTNPVQNKVIKEYVDENKVTVDSAISETSTNAIQNCVMTNFVNSSISTATATFRGTFNSKQALDETSGDKNDYAFLVTTDSAGNTLYNRYKFVEAESDLPEGYTPLLYISNGNTHPIIDTGIVPNIHTGFYIKFNPGDPDIWGDCYFGAVSDSNFGTVDWKYSENNNHHQLFEIFRSGAELTNTSHNSINEIVYSYPYITANNGTQQQVSPDDAIFTKDITIALFGLHYYSIGNYYDGVDNVQLYSFKLFDGSGNALRDFVPCKNDQNEVGLYDKVSETFFGNVKDSGVFIAGPNDTGHWEFEYSLNNSSFTSEQWAAINSGIKSQDVTKIGNLKPVATSGQYSDLEGTPTLGTAAAQNVEAFATAAQGGKADTAIQGIKVNSSTINPDNNKVINITVPTSAADVSALPDTTKYATALSLTINSSTFVVTGQLKDQNGDNLGTAQTIDLPLESVVVGGSYDSQTKKVVLTLQNGNTVEFSVADLVSGLQTELSTSNKLNPAFIEYDSTHRAVSDTEKSTWNNKQNALSSTQLDAVNSGINSTKVEQIETNKNNILSAYGGMVGKNLFDINNATESGKNCITAIIENDAITVTNTGNYSYVSYPLSLKAGTYRISATISDYEADEPSSCFIVVAQTSNASGTYLTSIPITGNGDVSAIFTINENKTVYITYCPMLSAASGTNTFKVANNMMMKNGDDTTYQPYIYSNAELTVKEQANESNISYLQELLSGMTVSRLIDFENDNTDVLVGDLTRLKCYSKMGRCNLNDAGEVTAWQGDENYTETGFMSDGTPVQTMVYVPKFYYRVEPLKLTAIGTGGLGGYHLKKAIISISDFPMPGYKLHPAFENEKGNAIDCFYIGAFESCTFKTATGVYRIDDAQDVVWTSVTGDKLASIGCSTAGDLTTGAKPTSGLSDVNAHRVNFETIATNRGPGWHSCLLKQTAAIQMLMLVEAGIKTQSSTIAVPNSQNNFGKGVVGITDNANYNCASLTGSTVGNTTGNAAQTYNEINGTKTAYTENGKVSVNYRGIENFYGNIWTFIWGLNIWGDSTMRGGAPYVCKDFNFAENVRSGNYEDAGFTAINPSSGYSYISAFGYGKEEYDWLFIGSDTTNAGENKVIGDFNYITYNLNGYRIALLGGAWGVSAKAGAFFWALRSGVGARARFISSRCMYIPVV